MRAAPDIDRVADELASKLQPGDLLFTALKNPMTRQIARSSSTWVSHVGIAFRSNDGEWRVAESAVPFSRCTSLERHLRRSEGASISVKRLVSGLSDADAEALWRSAQARLGRLYDLGFDYAGRRQFCSKFVREVYAQAVGLEIGHVETLGALRMRNPHASLAFWHLWFFGRIPWSRPTVTPLSQFESPLLSTVYERLDLRARAAIPARQSSISSSQSAL